VKNRDHNWDEISAQFVRAVRGKRSQRAFSRRLGYRSKPVADWEAGRRFPTASAMLRACQLTGIDVIAALHGFQPNARFPGDSVGPHELAAWLRILRGSTTIVELAGRADQPRFSVSRWLSGQSHPRLPQFFGLVHAITGRASDLIAQLVDIGNVPAIRSQHERMCVGRRLAYSEPWTSAVQRVLETEAYAGLPEHRAGWIADYLGIDGETETRCLDLLERAGMISRVAGKFFCSPTTIDTQLSSDENRVIKRHWAGLAAERLARGSDSDLFAYNVISVSRDDLQRIRELLRSTFREIRSLVSASEPQQEVALLQLQLVAFEPPSG
jgi:transcriptional regulator with XRE-family HTH domain